MAATKLAAGGPSKPETFDQLVQQAGLLPPDTLARARLVEAESGERLASVLTRLGLVSEQALAQAVARATGLRLAESGDYPAQSPPSVMPLSSRFLRDVKIAPLRLNAEVVEVACIDPYDRFSLQALAMAFRRTVTPVIGRAGDIEAALDRAFGPPVNDAQEIDHEVDDLDLERLADLTSDAPAIRMVNKLIEGAVEARASDIHLEPTESALQVRLRIDGAMRELSPLPPALKMAMVSRIKVMAGLNIAERRLPQDGRLRLAVRGHDVDLRVATSPTIHGEAVVLRLLDRSRLTLDFEALGLDLAMREQLNGVLTRPHGITLVTGPTGSGKTTTLYAALAALNAPSRKLLTIEDPIEYRLPGVSQTQVSPAIGLTFAAALRSFLRQDPDIMMVGEIRDLETAQVSVQAALTGHMILSTLHTNTAAAAITRLIDMGVEPFLITSTLNAVLSQRLVRRLCVHCREPLGPGEPESRLGKALLKADMAWRAHGCPACHGAGYMGRIAVLELLVVDETISKMILNRVEAQEIEQAAVSNGMRTMIKDGALKIESGLTTVEEILRVTREG
jgi:general secretion pathway protein E